MNRKKLLLTAIAVALVLVVSVSGAFAYFTTYAEAKGDKEIQLGYDTIIHEEVANLKKAVVIQATDDSEPVYVRVKAYTGKDYMDKLMYQPENGWALGDDGYYYYSKPIAYGEKTEPLGIYIDGIDEENIDTINIVVLHEATPVYYELDENGKAVEKHDWSMVLNQNEKGGDNNEK